MLRRVLMLGLGLAACGGDGAAPDGAAAPRDTPVEREGDAAFEAPRATRDAGALDARAAVRDARVVDANASAGASCPGCDEAGVGQESDARTADASDPRSADASAVLPLDAGQAQPADASRVAIDAHVVDASTSTRFPPTGAPGEPGPFATQGSMGSAEGPSCVIHRPAKLGEAGRRHPVILWGMGTGGFNTYAPSFELWASNGFVVAAALLGNGQGDGSEMLACLDYVCETYGADLDCERTGATGHSQGGGGAIMTGRDARVIATAPIQPYTQQGFGGFDRASIEQQHGPMLLLSGTNDTIAAPAANQQPVFDRVNQPVVWANLIGGDHVVTGVDGAASYREIVLAWFRLQLMDDDAFRPTFYDSCTLCSDPAWMVQKRD
jgi:hypothetical protein